MHREKLMTMEGDVLRAIFRAELRRGVCYGAEHSKKRVKAMADCIGKIFDVAALLDALAAFLASYADFAVARTANGLEIAAPLSGQTKKQQKPDGCLRLEYNSAGNLLQVSLDGRERFYCTLTELIDNLAYRLGMRLALYIQDDERLREFYRSYQQWLAPYWEQLQRQRQNFLTALLSEIGGIIAEFPQLPVDWMPVTVNVPYLTERLGQLLLRYRLSQLSASQLRSEIGFQVEAQQYDFLFLVDRQTYNAVLVQYWDKQDDGRNYRRRLNGEQLVALLQQLQTESEKKADPFFRLLAKELDVLLYELFVLSRHT